MLLTRRFFMSVGCFLVAGLSSTALGQPIAMRLITEFPDGYGPSVAADADHDGRIEIHATRLVPPNTGTYDVLERTSINGWLLVSRVPNAASIWDGGDSDQDGRFEVLRDTVANGLEVLESLTATSFPSELAYTNAGAGSFGGRPRFADDLDGDGRREVLWTRANGSFLEVVVLENTGDNTYEEVAYPQYGTSLNYAGQLASGDFDGDGRGDIVTGDSGGNVFVIEARENDTYELVWERNLSLYSVTAVIAVGDGDGDGLPEFAAQIQHPGSPERLTIFEPLGDDDYAAVFSGSLPSRGSETLHTSDLDGDGRNEIVAGSGNRIQIWKALANDTWEVVWEAPAGGRYQVGSVVADLNNNGFGEVLYTNAYPDNYHSFLVEWPFRVDASENDLDRPGDAIFTLRDRPSLRRIRMQANGRDVTRRIRDLLIAGDPNVSVIEQEDETFIRLDLPSLGLGSGRRVRLSISARDPSSGQTFTDQFTYISP